jgi:hypothetical protein
MAESMFHIRQEAFGQNMKYGLCAFVNVDDLIRTSVKVVAGCVYISAKAGITTLAFELGLGNSIVLFPHTRIKSTLGTFISFKRAYPPSTPL